MRCNNIVGILISLSILKKTYSPNPITILQILFERQGYVINVRAHTYLADEVICFVSFLDQKMFDKVIVKVLLW